MTMFSTHRVTRSLLGLLTALALFATSCGGSSADTAASVEQDATADASASLETEAEAAPAGPASTIVASTVSGGQIDFGSLAGQDVVLWYWAPW